MCSVLLHTTYSKWQYKPDIGFTKNLRPVQEIPFPALTICPMTKAKKTLTNFEFNYRQFFENDEVLGESFIESKYFEYLLHVCDPQLMKSFNFTKSIIHDNGDEFLIHLEELLYSLDESMFLCKWRDKYEGCDKIFNEVITDQGVCFTFNTLDHNALFRDGM